MRTLGGSPGGPKPGGYSISDLVLIFVIELLDVFVVLLVAMIAIIIGLQSYNFNTFKFN